MNIIYINPAFDELKERYDKAFEDRTIGKYKVLNITSSHNSLGGLEDDNFVQSSKLPTLRLHRKTDSKECLNNRGIGLISFVSDSNFELLPSPLLNEPTSENPIKLKDIRSKSNKELVAHYNINGRDVFTWFPMLLGLENSNNIIKDLANRNENKEKLEDLLVSN